MIEFKPWPKIARGKDQHITITEKLDGTNGCIIIEEGQLVGVQSRKRLITPEDDNYGFATWAHNNKEKLEKLGDGYHYGEWYGEGIQKNHHAKLGKHFALFNTFRFCDDNPLPKGLNIEIVPILFSGTLEADIINDVFLDLEKKAKEKKYTPEGIIVYYHNTKMFAKYTFKNPNGKYVKGR